MSGHELARNLHHQEPGRGPRHAIAADTPKTADLNTQRHLSDDFIGLPHVSGSHRLAGTLQPGHGEAQP